jgi:hypothetical protein
MAGNHSKSRGFPNQKIGPAKAGQFLSRWTKESKMPKLIIAKLKISASYIQDSELEASEVDFDTIQWWISDNTSWRIATYSIDNDIRIYSIGKAVSEAFALENTRKHYGDVIDKEIVLDIEEPLNLLRH